MTDTAAILNAARHWLTAATGIPDGSVILSDQSGPGLSAPFAVLKLSAALKPFGQDYRGQEYDGAEPAGFELELYATGPRVLSLSVNLYSKPTTGNGTAMAMLSQARDALELESVVSAFSAVGVAVQDAGEVRDLTTLLETSFQGRAHLELLLSASSFASERTTFIQSVSGTGTVSSDAGAPVTIPYAAALP